MTPAAPHPHTHVLVSYIQSLTPLWSYATVFFPFEDKRKHKSCLYLDCQVKLYKVVGLPVRVELLLILKLVSCDHIQIR